MEALSANRVFSSDQTRSAKRRRGKQRLESSLSFEFLEPRRLLATIVAADGGGSWLNSSTWVGGIVPGANDRVLIGKHSTTDNPILVTLNSAQPHVAKEIVLNGGNLRALEGAAGSAERTLTAEWMHVNSGGTFRVGLANNRYDNNSLRLTLTGSDPTADWNVQTATGSMNTTDNNGFLMTASGGQLKFFGDEKLSFTKLAATAEAGANTITVENVIERNFDGTTSASSDGELDWQVGDEIVIASSSYDYADEEVRSITAINSVPGDPTRTELTLNAVISHRHYGEVESYSNPTRTFDIDLRAKVALLNRTINIEGTQDTDNSFGDRVNYGTGGGQNVGIGAHAMIMPGSGQITIDGVRFDKMGQTGRLGRYPVHWHLAGDRGAGGTNATGDVMRNSSVTNSNNRGVTIHGTQNVLIEDNVLHDIHGHGFFMEDAAETGNQFLSNIVLGIHKVGGTFNRSDANDPFIVPGITRGANGNVNGEAARNGNGEGSHDTGQNFNLRFVHSAAYWITNPDNTWVGNVSAGSEGTGFWFALPDEVLGLSKDTGLYNNLDPNDTNLGQFDHNTTHSATVGLTFDRGADILPGSSNSFSPSQLMQVNHLTAYKHDGTAVYHRGPVGVFNESRFADNDNSSFNTFRQQEHNILFVGHSRGNADLTNSVGGFRLYDGPGRIVDSHFAGFAEDNAFMFRIEGGANKHAHTRAEGITFEADGSADHLSIEFKERDTIVSDNSPVFVAGRPDGFSGLVLDVDGSLTGHAGGDAGYVLTPKLDFYRDSTDIVPAGWDAYLSDDRFAQLKLGTINDVGTIPDYRIENGDGNGIVANRRNLEYVQRQYVKVNAGDYTVDFLDDLPNSGFDVYLEVQIGRIAGDATVLRFLDVAADYRPTSGSSVNSLTALRAANQTSWLRDYAGDLWMKVFESSAVIEVRPTNQALPNNPQSAFVATTVENGARIEAEEFDLGGQGFAYLDTTAGNSGNAFRTNQDVDIQATTDDGGGFNVGWTDDGEYLEYTTDIVGGVYDIGLRVASGSAGAKSIRLLVGDGDAAETFTELGVVDVPDTGGYQSWQTLVLDDIDLTNWGGSDRVLRVEIIGGSLNLNWLEFNDQQAPFLAQTIADDARVLVEEFDLGGEGVAYHDTRPGNSGGTARLDEDVDIGGASLVLTNIADGEWLEFTRDVTPGVYNVVFRVLANNANLRSIRLLIAEDDTSDTYTDLGSIDASVTTSGYENFVLPNVDLTSFGGSDRVLRLEFIGGQHNFNWFEFQAVAQPSSVVTRGVAYGGASAAYGEDAIDTTKSAYLHLPGTSSTVANYTNYTQGLNRVIVELANSQQATLTTSDFEFRVGNTNDPANWTLLNNSSAIPLPTIINGTRDGGSGEQRFTIAWDNANLPTIKNSWLQVTVKANANTGLTADDVFYFGNQVGDINGSTLGGRVTVNVGDTNGVRQNQAPVPNLVSMASPNYVYDLDRSGEVTVGDTNAARLNQAPGGGLLMITLPADPPTATFALAEPMMAASNLPVSTANPSIASAEPFVNQVEPAGAALTSPIEAVATEEQVQPVSRSRSAPPLGASVAATPVADVFQAVAPLAPLTARLYRSFARQSTGNNPLDTSNHQLHLTRKRAFDVSHQLRDSKFRLVHREIPSLQQPANSIIAQPSANDQPNNGKHGVSVDAAFAELADPFDVLDNNLDKNHSV